MSEKKIKYCKCGHNRECHFEKQPHSKLASSGQCNYSNCKCNKFLNRNKPSKADKIMSVIGVGYSGFAAFMLLLLYNGSIPMINKMVEVKASDLIFIAFVLVILGVIFILENTLGDYYKYKKRKSFHIED